MPEPITSPLTGILEFVCGGGSGTGGGGAPVDATYVTMSANSTLLNERILTAGPGITITDNGPNNTVLIETTGVPGGSSIGDFIFEWLIGDATSVIATGAYPTSVIVAPRSGTFTSWTVLSCDAVSPTAGAIVLDIQKDVYANYPPTGADSICGAGIQPNITATNIKNTSTSFASWTATTFLPGDIFLVSVVSATALKCVKLVIRYHCYGD